MIILKILVKMENEVMKCQFSSISGSSLLEGTNKSDLFHFTYYHLYFIETYFFLRKNYK